jgi:hypothetical protein
MPKSVVALKKVDTERNLNWYPCVLTTTKGYIFPELSAVDWHWFSAPIIELTKSNIDKIPIDSKAEIGDYVIALWLGNKYDKTDFESACGNLGLTVKRHLDLEE